MSASGCLRGFSGVLKAEEGHRGFPAGSTVVRHLLGDLVSPPVRSGLDWSRDRDQSVGHT